MRRAVLADLESPAEYRHGMALDFDWLLWRYTEAVIPGKSDGAIGEAVREHGDALRAYFKRRILITILLAQIPWLLGYLIAAAFG